MTKRRSLLSVDDLGREGIERVLELADDFAAVSDRLIPKVPTLRGRTVAEPLFFENSTRTRLSFETARPSAFPPTPRVSRSRRRRCRRVSRCATPPRPSMQWASDAIVIRHPASGAPQGVTDWVDAAVDQRRQDGEHEHRPRRCSTATRSGKPSRLDRERGELRGAVGWRSLATPGTRGGLSIECASPLKPRLGHRVTLVGPRTLLPVALEGWPVAVSNDLDPEVLEESDVCYVLRLQAERMREAPLSEPARVPHPIRSHRGACLQAACPARAVDHASGPDEPRRRNRRRGRVRGQCTRLSTGAKRSRGADGGALPVARGTDGSRSRRGSGRWRSCSPHDAGAQRAFGG